MLYGYELHHCDRTALPNPEAAIPMEVLLEPLGEEVVALLAQAQKDGKSAACGCPVTRHRIQIVINLFASMMVAG